MSLYDTFYLFYFFVITNKTTFGTFLVIAFFALNRVLFITIKHFNMKNLIFVFCLIAVCFLNASCEKCETCTTVITTSAQGIDDQVTTTTFEASLKVALIMKFLWITFCHFHRLKIYSCLKL